MGSDSPYDEMFNNVNHSERLPRSEDPAVAAGPATWNDNPRPYVWTKTADQILESITRYCTRINESGH
jgi:hypothetical protein